MQNKIGKRWDYAKKIIDLQGNFERKENVGGFQHLLLVSVPTARGTDHRQRAARHPTSIIESPDRYPSRCGRGRHRQSGSW